MFISPTQTMRQNMTIYWGGKDRSDVLSHACVSVQNNNGSRGRWSSPEPLPVFFFFFFCVCVCVCGFFVCVFFFFFGGGGFDRFPIESVREKFSAKITFLKSSI